MISIRSAALVGVLLTVAGGCVPRDPNWRPVVFQSDPLVHGPFLIGAERPSDTSGGVCCRPGAMRSQDVKGFWTPCEPVKLGCSVTPVSTDRAPLSHGGIEIDGYEAQRLTAQPLNPPGRRVSRRAPTGASAWDY